MKTWLHISSPSTSPLSLAGIKARRLLSRLGASARPFVPQSVLPMAVIATFLLPSFLSLVPRHAPGRHGACANSGCCLVCKMGKGKSCHAVASRQTGPVLSCSRERPLPATADRELDRRVALLPRGSVIAAPLLALAVVDSAVGMVDEIDRKPTVPPPRSLRA